MQATAHTQSLLRLASRTSVHLSWEGAVAIAARRWDVPPDAIRQAVARPAQRRDRGGAFRAGARPMAREATARAVAIYVAHVICGVPATELASEIGITRPGVSKVARGIEDRRDTEPGLDRALDEIELELMP